MPLLIFVSPSLMPPPPPLPTNTFRPMILDEQSQKQNELEQPRWEQMACNCLAEEARESIFTHPGGAAVAKRRRGEEKSAGAFVLIRYGLEEASEKYSSTTLGREIQKVLWVRPGTQS